MISIKSPLEEIVKDPSEIYALDKTSFLCLCWGEMCVGMWA